MKRTGSRAAKILVTLAVIEIAALMWLWLGPVPFDPIAIDIFFVMFMTTAGLLVYVKAPRRKPPIMGLPATPARKRRR